MRSKEQAIPVGSKEDSSKIPGCWASFPPFVPCRSWAELCTQGGWPLVVREWDSSAGKKDGCYRGDHKLESRELSSTGQHRGKACCHSGQDWTAIEGGGRSVAHPVVGMSSLTPERKNNELIHRALICTRTRGCKTEADFKAWTIISPNFTFTGLQTDFATPSKSVEQSVSCLSLHFFFILSVLTEGGMFECFL